MNPAVPLGRWRSKDEGFTDSRFKSCLGYCVHQLFTLGQAFSQCINTLWYSCQASTPYIDGMRLDQSRVEQLLCHWIPLESKHFMFRPRSSFVWSLPFDGFPAHCPCYYPFWSHITPGVRAYWELIKSHISTALVAQCIVADIHARAICDAIKRISETLACEIPDIVRDCCTVVVEACDRSERL